MQAGVAQREVSRRVDAAQTGLDKLAPRINHGGQFAFPRAVVGHGKLDLLFSERLQGLLEAIQYPRQSLVFSQIGGQLLVMHAQRVLPLSLDLSKPSPLGGDFWVLPRAGEHGQVEANAEIDHVAVFPTTTQVIDAPAPVRGFLGNSLADPGLCLARHRIECEQCRVAVEVVLIMLDVGMPPRPVTGQRLACRSAYPPAQIGPGNGLVAQQFILLLCEQGGFLLG